MPLDGVLDEKEGREQQNSLSLPTYKPPMDTATIRLPFKSEDVYHGLAEINGFLYVAQEGVVLEFQTKDAIFGVIKGNAKQLIFPYAEVARVEFKSNFWGTRFLIYPKSLKLLNKFPAAEGGRIKLKMKRRERRPGKILAQFIMAQLEDAPTHLIEGREPKPFFD